MDDREEIKKLIREIKSLIPKRNIQPGYIWVPYTISQGVPVIVESSNFPNKKVSSRYYQIKIK